MRGNEILEDILIVLALLFIVPIVAVLLLFFGVALLYASPIVIIAFCIWISIMVRRKENKKVTMGKIKLIRIPKSVSDVFKTITKVIIGILVLAIYLWIMIHIPIWLACTITLSICGYSVGKQLGKGGN